MTGGEVRIREQALPGIGHRFELDLAGGRSLVVVARRDGSRDVAVREGDDDATRGTVRLAREQAVAVGSLLLGARFAEGDLGTPRSRTGHLGPMTHHVGGRRG